MKNWTVIGAISSLIGLVVLIVGLAHADAVYNALNQLGLSQYTQLESTLYWTAFEPYLIGSIILFIIGGVGLLAGASSSPINVETPSPTRTNNAEIPPPTYVVNESNTTFSNKSVILCGSCRTMNDIDAVYCKKCGKQLRQNDASVNFKLT